jgi:ureidoacrylate peracid hydrolase
VGAAVSGATTSRVTTSGVTKSGATVDRASDPGYDRAGRGVVRRGGAAQARRCRHRTGLPGYLRRPLSGRLSQPARRNKAIRGLEDIPDHITARVVARCGTAHPFAALDPRRTALVAVDLQNAFLDAAAGYAVCATARDIVPDVNRLAAAVRAGGGGVFWIMDTFDAHAAVPWSALDAMLTPAARARREAAMAEGSRSHQLWPGLDVRPEDEIVRKFRFSAFLPGACELPDRLRARGFDTVLIAGTATNVCCESSARDAMMANFRTVMVSDANAALTVAEHRASLLAFYAMFGDVMDTDFVVQRLLGGAGAPADVDAVVDRAR